MLLYAFDLKLIIHFFPQSGFCFSKSRFRICYLKINNKENLYNLKIEINMKALKITLVLAVLAVSLTSCTKQDLNEDEVLTTYATGGGKNVK